MATASDPIETVAERLSAEHPTITETANGETREIVGDERDDIILGWARNLVESNWAEIRMKRNALLAASDWTQAADAPVDSAAWAKYRQALRDLPAKIKDPTREVKWPTPPGQEG